MWWLKSSNFLLLLCLSVGVDVYLCNMTSTLEMENKWNIFYLAFFFLTLSSYFLLFQASPSYLSPASSPLPHSWPHWFLGIFKPRHMWGMRKLRLFQKSFFFFLASDLFVHLKLHLIFHYYRSFHLISWIFSTWKKSTNLVSQYRIMGSNNSPAYDSSVTGAL